MEHLATSRIRKKLIEIDPKKRILPQTQVLAEVLPSERQWKIGSVKIKKSG